MDTNQIQLVLLLFILIGFFLSIIKRMNLWRKGTSSKTPLFWHLIFTIPKRYFVDLHHIVMRDRYMARVHILVAGSTFGLVVLFLFTPVFAEFSIFIKLRENLSLILSLLLLIGAFFLILRRFFKVGIVNLKRLSAGAYHYLPFYLIFFSLGMIGFELTDSGLVYTTSIVLLFLGSFFIFYSSLLDQPFKHLISGSLHLAFHPRQERFYGKNSVALKPLDLDKEEYGVNQVNHFQWNQILSFDACIECGKCQEVCPAYASSQPLNPKKLIQDLLFSASLKQNYSGEGYPGIDNNDNPTNSVVSNASSNPKEGIIPSIISSDTLYSCTTCRSCVEECPMMIEHVDAIVDLRRYQVLHEGNLPENSANVLDSIRYSDTLSHQSVQKRDQFLADLKIPYATTHQHFSLILWIGEAGFDLRGQSTVRKTAELLIQSGVDFAILENEPDVADLARRLGDEALFQEKAKMIVKRLNQLSFDKIITNDPHVFNSLKNDYQDFGGQYTVSHHSEYLLELIESGKLKVSPLNQTITYHDPCYLARYNKVIDSPRKLLKKLGLTIKEMEKSALKSRCCGWGGGAVFSDIPARVRIPDIRMEDVAETKVESVAVACPNCTTMLEGVVPKKAEVVDLAEYVYAAHKASN